MDGGLTVTWITSRKHRRVGGLSLVELMVALLIGSILSLGAIRIFISARTNYTVTEDLSRLQENARFTLTMLKRDLRMAGHVGCHDSPELVFSRLNADELLDTTVFVAGFEQGQTAWAPDGSTSSIADIVAGTDAITVRFVDSVGFVDPSMASATAPLVLANDFNKGDVVAVSDCGITDVFQITNADPSGDGFLEHATGSAAPGNAQQALSRKYGVGATVSRFVARRYYIGNGDNGPGLFQAAMRLDSADDTVKPTAAIELVEGVENMQITYGDDTDSNGVADIYADADAVSSWSNVVSVRLALLFRSVAETGPDVDTTASYMLNGTSVNPPDDRRRRRVFETTVYIRNMQ